MYLASSELRPSTHSVSKSEGVSFFSKDGIDLIADIYLPDGIETAPTILVSFPFADTFSNGLMARFLAEHWASRGYVVVIQGLRGRYKSGGEFAPLVSDREDSIEMLKWLGTQAWYDGSVLTWGFSSFGQSAWSIADQKDSGLAGMSMQNVSSNFYDMLYPGGAFSLDSALSWAMMNSLAEESEITADDLKEGINALPILKADDYAFGDARYYNDWILNKSDTTYWESIDGKNRNLKVQAPALLISGWFDPFLPSQLGDYENIMKNKDSAISESTRLVVGPWKYGQEIEIPEFESDANYKSKSVLLTTAWFDALLGINGSLSEIPKVRLFVMGENIWRKEDEWPLERTMSTPFYLSSDQGANSSAGDGSLKLLLTNSTKEFDEYQYNPEDPVPTVGGAMFSDRAGVYRQNDIESRSDILIYSLPILEGRLEATGPIKAVLYVSTDVKNTDFTVKLVDVYPNGDVYNVTDGILRKLYKGNLNKPEKIEVELWPTSYVFLPGHQIRIEISSSNFPRFDRNFNTSEKSDLEFDWKVAKQRIYHSKKYPSQIILPLIPPKGN